MRVAYLINQYPSPSHTFVRREIEGLEALGWEVARFSMRPIPAEALDARDESERGRTRSLLAAGVWGLFGATFVCLLRSPLRWSRVCCMALNLGWRSDRGVLRHLAYLMQACLLLEWMRDEPVDHLHAHFGTNPAAVALLCRELGGPPYSFTVHGPEEFDKPEFIGLGKKVHHAAFVVAISSYGRSQILRWCQPEDWRKVQVVRCGVDRNFADGQEGKVPDEPRLVCVGRLSEQKGHLILVEAAGRLDQEGLDFELVLVGDGPLRPWIEDAVRRHGLQEKVRLVGWSDGAGVRASILRARALVLPSFAEGLPVVLMESLALRRPVVTTYVAGIPELVESGTCGILVPAGSVDHLVDAMREILLAPSTRLDEMGADGAARVARMHWVPTEVARLASLITGVDASD